MYVPSCEQFQAAAESGNLIPVYREILADSDTPVSAYAKLGVGDYSFLLESVVGGEKWASYSFIGVEPRAVITIRGGEARVEWHDAYTGGDGRDATWETGDPAAALSEVMAEWKPVASEGLPRFWGGAVGWMSYDVVRAFESLPTHSTDDLGLPELCMVLTDTVLIFDNLRQTIRVVATPYVPRPELAQIAYETACQRIDAIIARLRSSAPSLTDLEPPAQSEDRSQAMRWGGGVQPESSFDRQRFLEAVDRTKEYILSGDIFQAVISQRFKVHRDGVSPFDVYRALRVVNPSPYMFHLEFPQAQVTGASPETLVRLDGRHVEVRPIAGTRPRGKDADADQALEDELKADPKEVAEHLMLVDLGRNDVGRVSATGSVTVPQYLGVEHYSHVMHLVSHVEGRARDGVTWDEVVRAVFPAGTLSGAPKIRAMEIIDELEPHRRGIYGGAVGYISYTGNVDMAIAIRTLVTIGDDIYVQAGGGVVHDSSAEGEYEESLNKARAVLRAVSMAQSQRSE